MPFAVFESQLAWETYEHGGHLTPWREGRNRADLWWTVGCTHTVLCDGSFASDATSGPSVADVCVALRGHTRDVGSATRGFGTSGPPGCVKLCRSAWPGRSVPRSLALGLEPWSPAFFTALPVGWIGGIAIGESGAHGR